MLLNSEIPKAPIVIKKILGKPTILLIIWGRVAVPCSKWEINEETED